MEIWQIVVWIIVIATIVWMIYAEFAFQGCYDGLRDCGAEWEWSPQNGDKPVDLIRRIELGNEASDNIIKRGLVVAGSGITAIVVQLYVQARRGKGTELPHVFDYLVTWAIILGLFWIIFRYYESHYTSPITTRTQQSIQELKYQLNIDERPTNVGAHLARAKCPHLQPLPT